MSRLSDLEAAYRAERDWNKDLRERIQEVHERYARDWHEMEMRHREEIANLKAGFVEEPRQSNAATAERTRQEVLETVLKALELPGYRSNGGTFLDRFDPSKFKVNYPTDRFWADINTAIEVRAECKAADERAATEAKIADLNKRESKNWTVELSQADIDLINSVTRSSFSVDTATEKKPKKGGKK